jgi:FXSXX-COOH protein
MHDELGDFDHALIDVTGVSLADLKTISGSSLDQALRSVLDDEVAEPVAGFSSRV